MDISQSLMFSRVRKLVKEKLTEQVMWTRLTPGSVLLAPLIVRSRDLEVPRENGWIDALIEVLLPGKQPSLFRFVVETKSRSTPEAVYAATAKARMATRNDEWPMIQVPYLAPDRLELLEQMEVSGVDLCGNGVVLIPDRLYVVRSGQPNKYSDSRPLNNPYRGKSALVARTLLNEPSWPILSNMVRWIEKDGTILSLAQASKAVQALEEDLMVSKNGSTIKLQDPMRLLNKLGSEWRKPDVHARKAFRIHENSANWISRLSSDDKLRWTVTGESSASRYVVFSQGGPLQIAVSNLSWAAALLGGVEESVPNFADVELLEIDDQGVFFQANPDEWGMRWASRLQTWLELQAGDARQQAAAKEVREQILRGLTYEF